MVYHPSRGMVFDENESVDYMFTIEKLVIFIKLYACTQKT